jgi:enoyl-CoA hydratase/carnithine racemase
MNRLDVLKRNLLFYEDCSSQTLFTTNNCSSSSNDETKSIASYQSLCRWLRNVNSNNSNQQQQQSLYKITDNNETVQTQLINTTLVITLNRPKAYNALTFDMIVKVTCILAAAKYDDKVSHLVLRSSHPKAFCAGGDVKSLNNAEHAAEFFAAEFNLNRMIFRYPKPVIALLNGITMGGGVGISVYCTYRVAHASQFIFAMPENQLGLFTDIGATWCLPHYCPTFGIAAYIALIGQRFNSWDCLYANLVTHVATNFDTLLDTLTALVNPTRVDIQLALDKFCNTNDSTYSGNVDQSSLALNRLKIDQLFNEDSAIAILQNLKHDTSDLATKYATTLVKQCPTSVVVTIEGMKRGFHGTLEETLQRDYRLGQRMIQRSDFTEGVAAVLITRDGKANFNPASLQEVSVEKVLRELFDKPLDRELQFCDN